MRIITILVGREKTNCYILANEDPNQSVIIDPGDNPSKIIKAVDDSGTEPMALIATHGDTDQVMAADLVQQNFNIPFYINKADESMLKIIPTMSEFASGSYQRLAPPSKVSYLVEGDAGFAGLNFKVMDTSGHTKGSMSLYLKEFGIVFTGDVISMSNQQSAVSMGLSGTIKFMSSVKRILDLPEDTKIYPSHSSSFTVGEARVKWSGVLKY